MNFKFALGSCIVHVDGNPVNLTAGEAWDAPGEKRTTRRAK